MHGSQNKQLSSRADNSLDIPATIKSTGAKVYLKCISIFIAILRVSLMVS